jgi:hypothetical protein
MDLTIWLPVTFSIGIGLFALCYGFLIACENI